MKTAKTITSSAGATIRRQIASLLLIAFWAFPSAVLAEGLDLDPRGLSLAERRGVSLAIEYLAGGPDAWLDDLAKSFPWQAREDALFNIELRLGPAAGARWQMATSADQDWVSFRIQFPSGLEEIVRIRLVDEEGVAKIAEVLAGFEAPRVAEETAPRAKAAHLPPTAASPWEYAGLALLLGLACLGLRDSMLHRRFSPFGLPALSYGVLLVALAALGGGCREDHRGSLISPPAASNPAAFDKESLAVRRALAAGLASASPSSASVEARLWQAEEALVANRFTQAEELLQTLPAYLKTPTYYKLRGRLASQRGDEGEVLRSYEELAGLWPYDEVVLVEAIEGLVTFGFDQRAAPLFHRLHRLKPRWPEAQELLALQGLLDELPLSGASSLEWAVQLGPIRRSALIVDPLWAYMIGVSSPLRRSLGLHSSKSPTVNCPITGAEALADSPGASFFRVGLSLFAEIGSSELFVPGGCELAPSSATTLSADEWLDRKEARLLAATESLAGELAGNQATGLVPAQRRRLSETLEALLHAERDGEILHLTEELGAASFDQLSSGARRARVKALYRAGRRKEAFDLLVAMVGADFESRRKDPFLLFDLAELMALERHYDLAQRLYLAGDRRLRIPATGKRRAQLKLEQKMIERSLVYERPPFKIYYPTSRGPKFAEEIAEYLAKERLRVGSVIPLQSMPREIHVLLMDFEDFRTGYGGGNGVEILGLYDGMIRAPLGGIRGLNALSASILTHELTHALIADASSDRAPHWFQEGLAQMVEPGRNDINPVEGLHSRNRWLAFPLIEAGLSGMATPVLAQQGYEESMWSAIFLQQRFGRKVFARLLESWRGGAGEHEALLSCTGLTPETLDEELILWGRSERVRVWATEKAPIAD